MSTHETSPSAIASGDLDAFLAETRYAAHTSMQKDGSPVTIFLGRHLGAAGVSDEVARLLDQR
jgi:hypothetical protein